MKKARVFVAAVVVVVALALVVACGETATPTPTATAVPANTPTPTATAIVTPTPTSTPAPTSTPTPALFPITITDSSGDEVTIKAPPERIVAIDGGSVEILFSLGEGHRVVGIHDFVTYPEQTESIQKLGSAFALNFEQMAALEPDLVFIFFDRFLPEIQDLGVQVLYLKSPATLDAVAERMRTWGRIVGKPAEGAALAEQFEESIRSLQERVASVEEGPRLYHDAAPGWWTAGTGSLASEMYTLLKAQNVFGDITGFQQVSTEEIVERDPQVIISVHPEGPEVISAEPALQGMSAVVGDRVGLIDGALMEVTGPRLLQGIEQVAKLLYPELFP